VLAEPRLQPGNNMGTDNQPTVKWSLRARHRTFPGSLA